MLNMRKFSPITSVSYLNLSYLVIALLSCNLTNAGLLDWLSTTKATAVEFSTENPVKASLAVGVTATAGIVAADCVAARLADRSSDDRRAWGTIITAGAIIGLGAWYKFTSAREANLKAAIAKNFAAIEENSGEITVGIAAVEKNNTVTGAALSSATISLAENGTALTAAQTTADAQAQAAAAAKASIDSLATDFSALNETTQTEILEKLTASGLTLEQALAKVNTSDLSSLLSSLGISQSGLSQQCTALERQAQETARQVELVKIRLARLAELETQAQAASTKTSSATTSH